MAKKTTQPKRLDANVGSGFAQAALGLEKSKAEFDVAKSQQGGQMIGAVEGVFSDYITKSEETRDEFLNEVDDTYEVNLLGDENLKQKFVDFATETKSFINENIEIAAKYSSNPSSKQYKEAVKNIEKGKNGLQKVFSQAQAMQKRRAEAIALGKGGNKTIPIGDYRDAVNNNFITGDLYKDLDITLDGGIYYDAGEGNIIPGESIGGNINFENAGLGELVTQDFIEDPIKLKKQGQNETTARDSLQAKAYEIFKDPKNVRQAVFNGINGNSNTRYIDYYILERHMAGDAAFQDLKFQDTNKDGQINNEDKIDGEFVLDKDFVNDRGEASQTAFDNHVERLKRDKKIDFSQGVKDFFVDMGMGIYSGAKGLTGESEETFDNENALTELNRGKKVPLSELTGRNTDKKYRIKWNSDKRVYEYFTDVGVPLPNLEPLTMQDLALKINVPENKLKSFETDVVDYNKYKLKTIQ